MIGSLVNYNWSKYSDIDLHIVLNYGQFPSDSKDLYVEFFDLKKIVFNQKHNIKLFGYDVECFVQDENEVAFSSGVYSLLYDMWVNEPKKDEMKKIDTELIKEKGKQWMNIIDGVVDNIGDESPDEIKSIVKWFWHQHGKDQALFPTKTISMDAEDVQVSLYDCYRLAGKISFNSGK